MGTCSATRASRAVDTARAALAAALLSVLLVVVQAGQADAAESSGTMAIKRQGATSYGGTALVVIQAGGKATFSLRVRNIGTEVDQFRVTVSYFDSFGVTHKLLQGSTNVTTLSTTPQGYTTPAIEPGKSLVLTYVQNADEDASVSGENVAGAAFSLLSVEGNTPLDNADGLTRLASPGGTTAWDGFARVGSGRFINGFPFVGVLYADALKTGQSATFTVRLENNSSTPSAIGLDTFSNGPDCLDWPYVIRDGLRNVTSAAEAGTFVTTPLRPGAHRDLKVRLTSGGTNGDQCTMEVNVRVLRGQGGPVNAEFGLLGIPAEP